MSPLSLACIAGARPNFMKVAAVLRAMEGVEALDPLLVHTGQHYDPEMSQVFFDDLDLPRPDVHLGVGSGSHATQTADIMNRYDQVMDGRSPDLTLVVGDVNSTLGCALVSAKRGVPVAHVEAGLRSFDRSMPEEINRRVTDVLSDFLFAPSRRAVDNLRREGLEEERIHFVGNVMVDTLTRFRSRARETGARARHGVEDGDYAVVTFHRPSNVDDPEKLEGLLSMLVRLSAHLPVLFPVHPRTRRQINAQDLAKVTEGSMVQLLEPLGYVEFLDLLSGARVALTDSGGIQEESTVLGVPCLTVRENTERPVTVEQGTNRVVGTHPNTVLAAALEALKENPNQGRAPEGWDGRAAERLVEILIKATENGEIGHSG